MEKDIKFAQKNNLRISRTALPDFSAQSVKKLDQNSQNLLNAIEKESREISMVITFDGQIKYIGSSVKRILGYEPFRLLGNNIQKLIPVSQWVAFRAALRASEESNNDEAIQIECRFIHSDDSRIFFSLQVKDYRLHPQIEGYLVQAINIQRRKQSEAKLKLRSMAIQQIKEAVVIINPHQKQVLFANKAFYDLSGFSKAEVMGDKLKLFKSPYSEMLFDEKTDPKQKEKFFKSLRNNTKYEGRIFSKRKDGSVFYNRFSMTPVLNREQQLTHYIVSLKAIRQRKRKAN